MKCRSNAFRVAIGLSIALLLATGCASSGSKGKTAERPKRTVLLTSEDDVRLGAEAAQTVEADVGLLEDPALQAYIEDIGKQLLRGLPRRNFAYTFSIVDQNWIPESSEDNSLTGFRRDFRGQEGQYVLRAQFRLLF